MRMNFLTQFIVWAKNKVLPKLALRLFSSAASIFIIVYNLIRGLSLILNVFLKDNYCLIE